MKVTFGLLTLLSLGLYHGVSGAAIREKSAVIVSYSDAPTTNITLSQRADDEWVLVQYNAGASGGQCGGTDTPTTGSALSTCVNKITGGLCIDFSLGSSTGIASCTVKFDGSKCGGTSGGSTSVDNGKSVKGYNIGDDVKFIEVDCEES
ncbi:hypothetical protein CONLIGDRAFT_646635 [Coniochaeta ligniaria NRRL 30616]|uniref:Uncharacterized protein n=1 Tax=Coniochaeta ligniaria NRRL 30616 TaxID=1408157 RepID=A0A1J7JB67_9PEZI|nr:hypothetical protein CONLIGDRAFT_646635 [Coniochaeta ligniaria NRRL 30616]